MVKPSILFILVLCIAGYYFFNQNPKQKLRLKRSNGYHTFLLSASAGLMLYGISCLIYSLCFYVFNWINIFYPSIGDFLLLSIFMSEASKAEIALFDVSVIALILSWAIPRKYYGNKKEREARYLIAFSEDSETPEFTQLFFRSMRFGLPVLFTLSDRKVYIGYIFEVNANNFNDISILPIFSGYRDKDDLGLVPVTPYGDILDEIECGEGCENIDYERFMVSLPIREIVHAHLHDFQYYEKFKEKEGLLRTNEKLNYNVSFFYPGKDAEH